MIWSFNGRISGCLPEDTGSIPVQIATVTPSSSGPGHRDLYPEFPDLIPDTRIRKEL